MKELISVLEDERGKDGCPVLPPFECESVNSNIAGTVEGASSCNSR
jgi:hypothetical protein